MAKVEVHAVKTTKCPQVPILDGFYNPAVRPGLIAPPTYLRGLTTTTYVITAAAFVYLVYAGATSTQDVTVTITSPTGTVPGFTCKSLGTYTGTPYRCGFDGQAVTQPLCNPSTAPVNCPANTVCPAGAAISMYSSVVAWQVDMTNVHFDSYAD
ncbi:Aste57867_24038 [Aphanomyces stellatus]|uniref:Aste57867_24038 protein n=1 Tax=Aphanomyces stellatus TaxID=120398 RepID=A0A485LQY4_9STRA|nr:hypothetical protein As57867_023965 [Aphanomyces stellatus]VFU00681.1 Aste57867_24038 [Aphanomyces stellatus]